MGVVTRLRLLDSFDVALGPVANALDQADERTAQIRKAVLHLGWHAGIDPPREQAVAIEAARRAGVGRVVFASFLAAKVESPFIVAPFLVYAECKLRQSGLGWTILRNGMYADLLVDYVPGIAATGRIPYPAGDGRVSYISRDDLARASAAACLDEGHADHVYELTGPDALSNTELAGIVSRLTGKPVRYAPASDEEFAGMCRKLGLPEGVARMLVSLYRAVARGDLGAVTDHVEMLTGKPPEKLESCLGRELGLPLP